MLVNKCIYLNIFYKNVILTETARNVEKSLKETIQQLNRCIVEKNAKIFEWELFSKTNTDEFKKKNHELEHVLKKAIDKVTQTQNYILCINGSILHHP